jgi:tetratricopeptide (TPR) repeat protein
MDAEKLCTEAEACLGNGEFKKAVVLLKKEANRPFAELKVRSLYGLAMASSDRSFYGFHRGIKWCSAALAQKEDDPYLLVNLGKVYLFHGLRVKALEYLNRAMALAPDDSYVRETRGMLGFRQRLKAPFLIRTNPINITLGKIAVSLKKLLSR